MAFHRGHLSQLKHCRAPLLTGRLWLWMWWPQKSMHFSWAAKPVCRTRTIWESGFGWWCPSVVECLLIYLASTKSVSRKRGIVLSTGTGFSGVVSWYMLITCFSSWVNTRSYLPWTGDPWGCPRTQGLMSAGILHHVLPRNLTWIPKKCHV